MCNKETLPFQLPLSNGDGKCWANGAIVFSQDLATLRPKRSFGHKTMMMSHKVEPFHSVEDFLFHASHLLHSPLLHYILRTRNSIHCMPDAWIQNNLSKVVYRQGFVWQMLLIRIDEGLLCSKMFTIVLFNSEICNN